MFVPAFAPRAAVCFSNAKRHVQQFDEKIKQYLFLVKMKARRYGIFSFSKYKTILISTFIYKKRSRNFSITIAFFPTSDFF